MSRFPGASQVVQFLCPFPLSLSKLSTGHSRAVLALAGEAQHRVCFVLVLAAQQTLVVIPCQKAARLDLLEDRHGQIDVSEVCAFVIRNADPLQMHSVILTLVVGIADTGLLCATRDVRALVFPVESVDLHFLVDIKGGQGGVRRLGAGVSTLQPPQRVHDVLAVAQLLDLVQHFADVHLVASRHCRVLLGFVVVWVVENNDALLPADLVAGIQRQPSHEAAMTVLRADSGDRRQQHVLRGTNFYRTHTTRRAHGGFRAAVPHHHRGAGRILAPAPRAINVHATPLPRPARSQHCQLSCGIRKSTWS